MTGRDRSQRVAWRLLRAIHLEERARLAAYGRWRRTSTFRTWQATVSDLYRHFVGPGDTCFDVGANLGNRVRILRALGARVVAIEPQERCVRWLHRTFGRDPDVTIVPVGLGAHKGSATLHVSGNTYMSSMSAVFRTATERSGRFQTGLWVDEEPIRVATLDALIGVFGLPAFCKIDVEGSEDQVLAGLSVALPALSFEFTPEIRDVAEACLNHLGALDDYLFNVGPVDSGVFDGPWVDRRAISARLDAYRPGSDAGDVYAVLQTGAAASSELGMRDRWPIRTTPTSRDGSPAPFGRR